MFDLVARGISHLVADLFFHRTSTFEVKFKPSPAQTLFHASQTAVRIKLIRVIQSRESPVTWFLVYVPFRLCTLEVI